MKELGVPLSRETGNLMRKYVERRIPLQEYKLLTQMAFLVADAWATGFDSQNAEMLGALSKMMYFIEQTALDSGRTEVSWLLTGLQEPPFQILVSSRRRSNMQQFCRLCSPSWVAANLAFIKDCDYMESRTSAANKQKAPAADPEEDGKKPRKPPKGKGKGKNQPSKEEKTIEV